MYQLLNDNYQNDTIAMMKRWLENRNNGKIFADYFHEYGYESVIIFDASEIGRILYNEIKDSDIRIVCFFDRNAEGIRYVEDKPVYTFSDMNEMLCADVVVVSPVYNYYNVVRMLMQVDASIRSVSMKEAVYEF